MQSNSPAVNYTGLKRCPECRCNRVWLADENMRLVLKDELPIENSRWQYYCDRCDYQGPFELTKAQAKSAWNKIKRR